MKDFFNMLKEEDQKSLSRYMAFSLILLFIIVSVYLVITNHTWGNYDTFTFATVLGGTGTQMTNKFINSKYNTKSGEVGKPIKRREDYKEKFFD